MAVLRSVVCFSSFSSSNHNTNTKHNTKQSNKKEKKEEMAGAESWQKRVFYAEGWLCLLSGLFMFALPSLSLETMGVAPSAAQGVAADNLRQFASMVILVRVPPPFSPSPFPFVPFLTRLTGAQKMGYVGVRAPVVKEVIEAALLGDFVWMAAFFRMIDTHGAWTAGSVFSMGVTALLALVRISFLLPLWLSGASPSARGATRTKRDD